jgi:AraC-like DNA-binding protein
MTAVATPASLGDAIDMLRIQVRNGVGATGVITQQRELTFKHLFVSTPLVIFVERGVKTLQGSGGKYVIRAGEAVAVAGGQSLDITNTHAVDGAYRAHWLACDRAPLATHARAYPQHPVVRGALALPAPAPEFGAAFRRASQAIGDETIPAGIACHRLAELLLWIGLAGGRFDAADPAQMSIKIRTLIGEDLARNWSAADIAAAFAMSEATLRRRLSDEGTSLTTILVDMRMGMALQLLQSTVQPVTQIALSVGYLTSSQFAVRFRARFGFAPTAVRGHRRAAR